MSEFSDSIHVVTWEPRDASRMIETAGESGVLLLGVSPSVACLVRGTADRARLPRIALATPGPVIYYTFAEDHGCWVYLYVGGDLVAELKQSWETGECDDLEKRPDELRSRFPNLIEVGAPFA